MFSPKNQLEFFSDGGKNMKCRNASIPAYTSIRQPFLSVAFLFILPKLDNQLMSALFTIP